MDAHKEVGQKSTLASAEKPNLFLEDIAGKVKQLSPGEAKEKFKDMPKTWKFEIPEFMKKKEYKYEILDKSADFEVDGRYFRVEYSKSLDTKLLKAIVYQLNVAVSEFSKIVDYNKESFLIRIHRTGDEAFQNETEYSSGKEIIPKTVPIIGIPLDWGGIGDIVSFSLSFESGKYEEVSRAFRASLRHELIHDFRGKLAYGYQFSELLPQLGDFLYDPTNESSKMDDFLGRIERMSTKERYKEVKVGMGNMFKLLLWEYKEMHPSFKVPELEEEQMALLKKLPSLYEKVPPEQRDAILKKYLLLSDKDIMGELWHITNELGLKF